MTFFKNSAVAAFFALVIFLSLSISQEKVLAQQSFAPIISEESQAFLDSLGFTFYVLEKKFYYGLTSEQKNKLLASVRDAINKELSAIDPHTLIFSEETARDFNEKMAGTIAGIGAVIRVHPDDNTAAMARYEDFRTRMMEKYNEKNPRKLSSLLDTDEKREIEDIVKTASIVGEHGMLIEEIIPGSPAEKAGLKKGLSIQTVDGKPLRGMQLREAIGLVKGPSGTDVALGVLPAIEDARELAGLPADESGFTKIVVTRAIVEVPQIMSASYDAKGPSGVPQKIGYVKIAAFAGESVAQFEEHLRKLNAEKLIIDVRGNSGGKIDDAYGILDRLMPEGLPMFFLKGRGGEILGTADSNGDSPRIWSGSIVVLTDHYSASASEILAGVLRDHKLATLIGTKTLGKGSMQLTFPLPDKTMLKVTTALYALPSKEFIDGKGIEPHISVEDDPATEEDEVLQAALKFLAKK